MAEGNAFGKETFLDLVKLRSQAKKRKQTHRDQERNMGGGAGIESAYLETLHSQTGKSLVPFPKRSSLPPTPHHQPQAVDVPKWTQWKRTPPCLHSNVQGSNGIHFHMCCQVWNLLDLESHSPLPPKGSRPIFIQNQSRGR